jgi:predicted transcriptional regulator
MTQSQGTAAMGTTQSAVARLESGRVRPTTRTLEPRQGDPYRLRMDKAAR